MLILTWLVTFFIVVGLGIYSGMSIKSSNQWTGADKSLGAISIGCIFAAWQIGGMAIVGAAQNGYNLGISGAWYSIAGSFYFIALAFFAKIIRTKMPGESVPSYLQTRFDKKTAKLYSIAWIIYGFFYIPIQLTITVTKPEPIFSYPTRFTFAAFTIASAASIAPTKPFVSTIPKASEFIIYLRLIFIKYMDLLLI